jgi:hypothetical protein
MKKLNLFLLLCFHWPLAYGQALFTEIQFDKKTRPDLQNVLVSDSIFLTYNAKDHDTGRTTRQAMWISGSAKKRAIEFGDFQDKVLIAVASQNDVEEYYFLESGDKSNVLTCLTLDKAIGIKKN